MSGGHTSESSGSVEELIAKYNALSDVQRAFETVNVRTALAKQSEALNGYKPDILKTFAEIEGVAAQYEAVLSNTNWSIGGGATDDEIRLSAATRALKNAFEDFPPLGRCGRAGDDPERPSRRSL